MRFLKFLLFVFPPFLALILGNITNAYIDFSGLKWGSDTLNRWSGYNNPLNITAEKPEGIWTLRVQDLSGFDEEIFQYDATAPDCVPDTSTLGVNGSWAKSEIITDISCSDYYHQDGTKTAGGSGCDNESLDPSSNVIANHDKYLEWTVSDLALNSRQCTNTAASKIDWNPPDSPIGISSDSDAATEMQIEHLGLELESQNVSTDSSSPAQFRANVGMLNFSFSVQDSQFITAGGADEGFTSGISGLDFSVSKLVIEKIAPVSSAQTKNIILDSLFTAPNATDSGDFTIDLNSYRFDANDEFPIFTQTGKYKIWLELDDLAGNETSSSVFYIDIYPSDANNDKSNLVNFTCGNSLANNSDTCTATLTAKDEFGNLIFGREFQAYFAEQNTDGNYNLLADTTDQNISAQTAFRNGLRFASTESDFEDFDSEQKHTETFETATGTISSPGTGKTENIKISSLVPTIEVCASNDLENFADGRARNTGFLAKNKSRTTTLYFDSPPVLTNGQIDEAGTPVNMFFDPTFNFGIWAKAGISDNSGGDPSQEFNILLDEEKEIYVQNSTGNTSSLPTNFQVYLYGQAPEDTKFDAEELGKNGNVASGNLDGKGIDFSNSDPSSVAEKSINTHLRGIGDVELSHLQTAFTSQVKIQIAENDSVRNIIYPGGNFGNQVGKHAGEQTLFSCADGYVIDDTEIKGFTIGANISGNILTSGTSAIQNDESTAVDLGGIEVKDIREETTTNAYEIIRGMDPTELNERIEIADFSSGKDVIYYSGGTVQLGEASETFTFSGVKTIVIEDGNLLIAGDMEYNSPTDSLGVILINSNIGEKPETGNIFINKDVKKFVGTYFADGSLTSTTKMGTYIADIPQMSDVIDRDAAGNENVLNKQLLLEGTLFTKNTLGGAMLGEGNLRNPWGEEPILDEAQKYDLHFVRRYSPLLFSEDEKEDYCVISGEECDPEGSSFLIRPDNRVQFFPPPGFSSN